MDFRGTRWYKCDLHLHTPASKCFKDKDVTPKQWVERAIEQGLDCVAVTDHNTGGWIDLIKMEAKDTRLKVFPGVEVTCSDAKVHLLVLFDVDKGTIEVEDFLISIGIERNDFSKETAYSDFSIQQVTEKALEKNALVIPAHVDEFNSISNVAFAKREKFLESEGIDAVQVVHKEFVFSEKLTNEETVSRLSQYYKKSISDENRRDWKATVSLAVKKNKTILTFSDNPCDEGMSEHGLWGIGKRYTWIKMNEKVNLESLRQALLVPKFRVRNDFASENCPYKLPDQWIESIKIFNTSITNQLRPLFVEFSPQLTTIIGGRGTGKSSLFRFLRGVFNRTSDIRDLEDILKEHTDFFKLKGARDNKGVLQKDTNIEIVLNRNNLKYKICVRNFNESKKSEIIIEEWNNTTKEFERINLEGFLDLFKFDIFSQKQIYEIAQTPNALRNRIDNSIENFDVLLANLSNGKLKFMEQSAKIRTIQQKTALRKKLETEIIDNEKHISSFKESRIETLYNNINEYDKDQRIIDKLKQELETKKTELSNFKTNIPKFEYIKNQAKFSKSSKDELSLITDELFNKMRIAQSDLEGVIKNLNDSIKEFNDRIEKSNWKKQYNEEKELIDQRKKQLQEQGINDLQNIEKLREEGENKKAELSKIKELEKEVVQELEKKEQLKDQYVQLRKKITEQRQSFVREYLNTDSVKLEIKPFRDKESLKNQFRTIIQRETGFEEDIDKFVDSCFNGNVENQLKNLKTHLQEIRNGVVKSQLFGGRFQTLINSLSMSQIDEIDLLFPEDEMLVFYKPFKTGSFKPLSNASAGQKTSAILTFILSYGNNPILLDQPEDDLDNHLIYELIVKRLRKSKEHRQIIIITHNANIPVNGDAEYVIAMNPEIRTIEVLHNGAIEESEIRKEICEVMEGGEDAFQLRSKRYKID